MPPTHGADASQSAKMAVKTAIAPLPTCASAGRATRRIRRAPVWQPAPSVAPMVSAKTGSASATRVTCWISRGNFVYHTVLEDVELGESVWHQIHVNVVKGE